MPENEANIHSKESSPLLSRDGIESVDPGGGIAPEGPPDTTAGDHGTFQDLDRPEDADGEALERQDSVQNRLKQYEGLPDVKKKLKYIFPALAIGVSFLHRTRSYDIDVCM